MSKFTIYSAAGVAKAVTDSLELHDEWMAECFLTVTVKSEAPVTFSVGDYITYRNERYTINYDPTVLKKASSGSYAEGFTYDNIKFVGVQDEIVRCDFLDIVLGDNDVHYTALPTFPFYCETVDDLLDRIQANLESLYPGQWTVICLDRERTAQRGAAVGRQTAFTNAYDTYIGYGTEFTYEKTGVAETVDNITCWDALKKAHDDFLLNFIIRGRVVIVGSAGSYAATNFRYGKGNGLYEIERIGDSEQQVITRLRAYGSETNLPSRYYANLNMAIFGYALAEGEGDVSIDVDFRQDYFLNGFYSGQTDVSVRIGSTNYPNAAAWVNGDTGKIIVHTGTSDHIAQNAKIYFTSGVDKDKWPTSHREYGTSNLPDNMAVSRLMLPGFPNQSLATWVENHRSQQGYEWLQAAVDAGFTFSQDKYRPYIDSPNKTAYGVRPASIYFDGSNETEDIHPTIEGTGVDVIYSSEQITDNGIYDIGDVPNFHITLPDLGFDLGEVWNENASIDMKDGMCGARSFVMASRPVKEGNRWVCEVKRSHDDSLDLWFPYNDFNIAGGDHYVLIGIDMPAAYVDINAVKLLKAAIEALSKNHAPRFTFQPRIDEIFMQRQHDTAMASQGAIASLHDTLKAGDYFTFEDEDLDIDASVIIDVLTIRENGNNGIPTYEVTLRNEKQVSAIQKIQEKVETISSGGGMGNSNAQLNTLIEMLGSDHFLSKVHDDTAQGFITFMKGFQVGGQFVTGLLGEGGVFRKDADGTTYIEADKLYIRMKAYFDTVEIRRFLHSGGNRIATVAGVKCVRVEWLDSSGHVLEQTDANLPNTVKFRCYFRGDDGDVNVTNDWVVGDQAYCHISNVTSSSSLYMHHFWRLVVGKSSEVNANGEHYIDLSNTSSNTISGVTYAGYQADSDIPVAQDDIIQLGNVNDADRRGAIIEFVSGEDAPSYQVFQGLGKPVGTSITEKRNSQYSLTGKNYISFGYSSQTGHAYMKVYGDVFIGDPNRTTYIEYKEEGQGGLPELNIKANVTFTSPTTHQDTTLEDFATAVVGDLDSLQEQIDGSIETWFYGYVPTLSNAPASSWTTAAAKNNHLGDLFYDTTTGYAYRFANTGTEQSPVYEWLRITDTDVVKALADAAKAQDTADHKRRVFVVQPTPPYDAGDLWVNATYPEGSTSTDAANNQYYNEILKCVTPKGETGQFAITDWALASKYTDDSALINFVTNTYAGDKANLQSQIDGKAETWYQAADPATAWTTAALKAQHAGDLWYNTTNKTTWYYKAVTEGGTTTYSWEQQNIPQSVFDTIDGKSSIYVTKPSSYETNDIWIIESSISSSDLPTGCVAGDIVVATSNSSSYNKAHWQKKDRYTDDSTVNAFINSYGTILGITPTAQGVGQALGYLDKVLSTGSTQIDGGLVLTNILYMKDTANTPSVRAGISGLYKSSETGTGYKGHGTAAWFGGGVSNTIPIDHEVSTSASDYAKILFRFDGSGYLAGGNITWDKNGIVTIANVYSDVNGQDVEWKGTSLQYINQMSTIFPTTLRSGTVLIDPQASFTQLNISHANGYSFTDLSVLNRGENDARYVRIDFFNRLFQAYKSSTISDENKVAPNDITTTINNLKIMVGTWTEQYLTSLGHGSGGSGGSATLYGLLDVKPNDVTTPSRVYGLDGTSSDNGKVLTYSTTYNKWVASTVSAGGGGVDMAAVWSALNAATNEQINASHLTNALSGYATTSDLNGYLPLSAGNSHPLTGSLYFNGNSGINWGTSTGMLACAPTSGWTGISSTQWGVGATAYQGVIRTNNNDILHYKSGTTYKIWDESNLDISGLFTALTSTNATNLSVTIGGTTKTLTDVYAYQSKNVLPIIMAAGDDYDTLSGYTLTRGCFVAMNYTGLTTNDVTLDDLGTYDTLVSFGYNQRTIQFKGNAYGTMRLKYRRVYQPSSGVYAFSPWKELAFADGNIATATALATARTLWGQSFDGTSDVTGTISVGNGDVVLNNNKHIYFKDSGGTNRDVLEYSAAGNLHLGYGTAPAESNTYINGYAVYIRYGTARSYGLMLNSSGNVGIGTISPSYLLHVNGQAAAQTFRSTVETGTAPLVVASSTLVTNLNADRLDGKHASDFATASDVTTLQGYFDSSGAANSAVKLKTTRTIWGQNFNGTANVTGDMTSVGSITLTNNSRISNSTGSGGSLYIGRADDAGWVKMSDMCSRQGDSYWKIKSNGDATFGNMLSNGYVTALSDARYKTIVGDIDITVEQIAALPTILYKRNDRHDDIIFAGSIAQEWQKVLPQVVMTSNDYLGTLSIAHGVGASIFAIVNSRKLVSLEKRIERLEKRVNIEPNKTE